MTMFEYSKHQRRLDNMTPPEDPRGDWIEAKIEDARGLIDEYDKTNKIAYLEGAVNELNQIIEEEEE